MLKRCLWGMMVFVIPVLGVCSLNAPWQKIALLTYVGMSFLSFIQFGLDKRKALKGGARVSEKTLYLTALVGGWPGAWLGRMIFRHKTTKQPFVKIFYAIVALHQSAWCIWLYQADLTSLKLLLNSALNVVGVYV